MYFKAVVTDEEVKIRATRDIKDAMLAVTMICRNVNEIKGYSETDRAVFRKYVDDELAKLAFSDASALVAEEERLKELCENCKIDLDKKSLKKILEELGNLLDEVEDEE